jgi:hypothetical protein
MKVFAILTSVSLLPLFIANGPSRPDAGSPTTKAAPSPDGGTAEVTELKRALKRRQDFEDPLNSLGAAAFKSDKLSRRLRFMLFTVVTSRNRCLY